jgi:hypothetical protein
MSPQGQICDEGSRRSKSRRNNDQGRGACCFHRIPQTHREPSLLQALRARPNENKPLTRRTVLLANPPLGVSTQIRRAPCQRVGPHWYRSQKPTVELLERNELEALQAGIHQIHQDSPPRKQPISTPAFSREETISPGPSPRPSGGGIHSAIRHLLIDGPDDDRHTPRKAEPQARRRLTSLGRDPRRRRKDAGLKELLMCGVET